MSPDPPRPPPPVATAPRPPRTRGGIIVAALALVAIGLPTILLLFRGQPRELQTAEATADRFVRAITLGSSPAEGGRTGFQAAYDQLSENERDALPFDVFFDEWQRFADSRGLIVDSVRTSEMPRENPWTREARDVTYLLFLGGENQEHADLATVEVRLAMAWDRKNRRFVVSKYSRTNVPNPRATR